MKLNRIALRAAASIAFAIGIACEFPSSGAQLTREVVLAETLRPYTGPTTHGVDTSTLSNKVMCGYQGWFNAEGDGAERGWIHWTKRRGPLGPSNAKIDLWPDVSELGVEEKFATGFTNAAGRTLEVFSSFKQATVLRHFQWMREYGIDGAFVQRFITDLRDPRALRHNNTVLANCREGANRFGRAYAVMYDLSGLGRGLQRRAPLHSGGMQAPRGVPERGRLLGDARSANRFS